MNLISGDLYQYKPYTIYTNMEICVPIYVESKSNLGTTLALIVERCLNQNEVFVFLNYKSLFCNKVIYDISNQEIYTLKILTLDGLIGLIQLTQKQINCLSMYSHG